MGYSEAQAKTFIKEIGPYVQKYAKEYGYKVCSPIIAQAICESGITSKLAVTYHNYFGLKAGSSKSGAFGIWDGTVVNMSTKEEYTPGTLTTIRDLFRVFKADATHTATENGVRGYFEFINYSRYQNLKSCTSPKAYLQTIVADKYCTSSTYVNTCLTLIGKYKLTQYDGTPEDSGSDYYVVGKTYTTQTDLYIRDAADGNKVKYDCVTKNAKDHAKFDDQGCAILNKGSNVTCKEVKGLDSSTWIRIPSGWICAISKDKVYVK